MGGEFVCKGRIFDLGLCVLEDGIFGCEAMLMMFFVLLCGSKDRNN
jgi:hypothetical protein